MTLHDISGDKARGIQFNGVCTILRDSVRSCETVQNRVLGSPDANRLQNGLVRPSVSSFDPYA